MDRRPTTTTLQIIPPYRSPFFVPVFVSLRMNFVSSMRLVGTVLSNIVLILQTFFPPAAATAIVAPPVKLTNSTLYTLCRNSDVYDLLDTIVNYEARFNHNYHYDWVFLNDQPFDDNFKLLVSNAVSGTARFGLVPESIWEIPESVDRHIMETSIRNAMNDPDGAYPYADSLSYRKMCRFESGFFQWHPLLMEYDFFWRVEPGVKLHCDINYDIFKYMIDNNFNYGFTISMLEYDKTIPTLFKSLWEILDRSDRLELLHSDENYSNFILNVGSNSYSLCHFWTNFEIGNLNIFRSEEYTNLFNELDAYNGFFYERWGDAPVRTLILSLIMNYPQITRFKDLGYQHDPYIQCPQDLTIRAANRCSCDTQLDITNQWFSCSWFFDGLNKRRDGLRRLIPKKSKI